MKSVISKEIFLMCFAAFKEYNYETTVFFSKHINYATKYTMWKRK